MSRVLDLDTTPIDLGVTVVEASAGTGKTYCLVGLVLRLLLERRVSDVSRILVVTFTNAATNELTTRLREALRQAYRLASGEGEVEDDFLCSLIRRHTDGGNGEADRGAEVRRTLRHALLHFDDLGVFTIHGFCKRVLEESAFESGTLFRPELIDNDEPLLRRAAEDFWRRRLYPAPPLLTAVATAEGWTPATFLEAYRVWRRHPRTELLPEAQPLAAATATLEEACAALGAAWNRAAVRSFLSGLDTVKNAPFDPAALEPLLDDLESFCRDRRPGGVKAVKLLAGEALCKAVYKKHHDDCRRHPFVRACDRFTAAVAALEHALRVAFVAEVDELFERAKRDAGNLAFDDLLRRVWSALRDPQSGPALTAAVRGQYEAALIDEFQDTDLIQYEIFHRLFSRDLLYLIGDPKQAIYRFRGADVFAYMAAKGDADQLYTLDRNWRSDPALVRATNALFTAAPRPFVFPAIPYAAVDPARDDAATLHGDGRRPFQWLWLPRELSKEQATREVCAGVAAEVARLLGPGGALLGERRLAPSDVAVLVRTNDQAAAVQEALRRSRVPAVVSRAGDVFHSDEMAELHTLLAAVADPTSATRLRAAWATRLWGDDAAAIRRLNDDDDAWQERFETFEEHRRQWLSRGFMPMIARLLAERGVRRRLLAGDGGERRLTNLLHAVEVLHQAILERHLSPAGLLVWLAGERDPARQHDADATELRLESDAEAVQISTVHKSKGLEYGVVFCPFLWDALPATAPALAHAGERRVVYDFGSAALADHLAQAEAERLAEDLRLAYVAVTRARHRCCVVWGAIGRDAAGASALAYLLRPADAGAGEEPPGEFVRRAREQMAGGAFAWRRAAEALAAHHPQVMEVRDLEPATEPDVLPRTDLGVGTTQDLDAAAAGALACRELPATAAGQLAPWQMASFTTLSRTPTPPAERLRETPDYRDPAAPPALQPWRADAAPPAGIFAFARGTRAGTCLHEVLEQIDFTAVDTPATAALIAEALRRHGLDDPARHAGPLDPAATVAAMVRRVAATPLPGAGFPLAAVARDRTLAEWRFYTPLPALAPRQLTTLFADHGAGAVAADYPAHLAELDERRISGFLTGFVDLVFCHGERWYVVDWKSNHLGDDAADYGRDALWLAMRHHHYVLQYHLYLTALQRFLRHRLPAYDYGRHVGGVCYVFLRGVTGDAGAATGWYADRPPRVLIDALERALAGPPASAGEAAGDG